MSDAIYLVNVTPELCVRLLMSIQKTANCWMSPEQIESNVELMMDRLKDFKFVTDTKQYEPEIKSAIRFIPRFSYNNDHVIIGFGLILNVDDWEFTCCGNYRKPIKTYKIKRYDNFIFVKETRHEKMRTFMLKLLDEFGNQTKSES